MGAAAIGGGSFARPRPPRRRPTSCDLDTMPRVFAADSTMRVRCSPEPVVLSELPATFSASRAAAELTAPAILATAMGFPSIAASALKCVKPRHPGTWGTGHLMIPAPRRAVTAGAIRLRFAQAASALGPARPLWSGFRHHPGPQQDGVVAHALVGSGVLACSQRTDHHQVGLSAGLALCQSIRGVEGVSHGPTRVLDAPQVDCRPDVRPSAEAIEVLPVIIPPPEAS